ncbi:MAG: class SAM-dependent methyltransferase [Bacteroidetes bacterium]|nr:class SAM-dependent methyltransferase [Bacteroidota bacterium]
MKKYLYANAELHNMDFVSCIDELPLWSAPFGLSLLDTIEMKPGLKVLDVGCGCGFPLIELAQRLGNTCNLTGIDPWETALGRVRLKMLQYGISNTEVLNCCAETMPFQDGCFTLIVSNNGLNNVENLEQAVRECGRVAAPGAQLVLTQNLEGSMIEFYSIFEKVLSGKKMRAEIAILKNHIYQKRKPVQEVFAILEKNQFTVGKWIEKSFYLRFLNAEAMLNHSFIRFWFADSWGKIIHPDRQYAIFTQVEKELNRLAMAKGEIRLTIPYIVVDCRRQ